MAQSTSLSTHLESLLSSHPDRKALARDVLPSLLRTLPIIARGLRTTSVSQAGSANTFGDEQLNVDVLAENIIRDAIAQVPSILTASSEEDPVEKPAYTGSEKSEEKYTVAFDPLDGAASSLLTGPWGPSLAYGMGTAQ